MPQNWTDEIVVDTIRRNPDGTVTVVALVNIYDDKGNCFSTQKTMKLRKCDG